MQNKKLKFYKAKKSLGQNFLKSKAVLEKIVEAGEIKKEDVILEIGPGKGALTEKLLEKSDRVIAIEKDDNLFSFLQEKFEKAIIEKKLNLKNEDILDFEIKENYKIIANIPYNITGAILKKFLAGENQPERMVLMVQKEVADRILARDEKESLLSISVKTYGTPKMVAKVPARFFSPAPKVDSAVISIKNIGRKIFENENLDEELLWEIIRAGFAHKRKKLSSNLKNFREKIDLDAFERVKNLRAENLSIEDWILLVEKH